MNHRKEWSSDTLSAYRSGKCSGQETSPEEPQTLAFTSVTGHTTGIAWQLELGAVNQLQAFLPSEKAKPAED